MGLGLSCSAENLDTRPLSLGLGSSAFKKRGRKEDTLTNEFKFKFNLHFDTKRSRKIRNQHKVQSSFLGHRFGGFISASRSVERQCEIHRSAPG